MKVKDLFVPVIVGGVALFGYDKYKSHLAARAELQAAAVTAPAPTQESPTIEDRSWIKPRDTEESTGNPAAGQFKCDGRTHCSQMTSCAEAVYFLQHCPDTKMDGNNDGEPCEQQWCN